MAQAQPAPSSFPSTIPTSPTTHQTAQTYISLTPHPLSPSQAISFVRSPSAGATVLFIGTTRDTFADLSVSSLSYTSYIPLAISTLRSISSSLLAKHEITKIAIVHRLGEVGIGEESIVIAVSAKHRQAAWRAGEEALEETKRRAEIWKLEKFVGGEGVWRANRDGVMGVKVGDEHTDGEGGVEKEGEVDTGASGSASTQGETGASAADRGATDRNAEAR